MKSKDIMNQILNETYILNSALEAEDIDMVLETLKRREVLIDTFGARKNRDLDEETLKMVDTFETENTKCMALLEIFRENISGALYEIKAEKNKTLQKLKVHDSYSNPYAKGVGTSFDLKK